MAVLSGVAVAVGGITALGAIAFVDAVAWLNDALLVSPRARVQVEDRAALVAAATVLVPTLGGLLVGLLLRHGAIEGRPLGPPDAIRAVQTRGALPSVRSGVVSSLAAALSLGCGASVGQYGPMVYLGTLFGALAARVRTPVRNLRTIAIGCGVAAAIATAFNAPIAGLVFAHEVILRHYSIQAFAPTTVAAATGFVVANVVFDRPALFLVAFDGVAHGYEFPLFALVGVLSALLAVGFMRLLLAAPALAARLRLPAVLRPALAGLAVGAVALALPDVLGIGTEALRFATIEGAFAPWELALLIAAKIALTALCLGWGFAGGVFSPALLIGILFGALLWTGFDGLLGVPNSGLVVYAICGMMALTSPVIGAPLTTILIVFELTHSYDLTIAAMVAVVFSNLVSYQLLGRSLFDVQLARKGVDLSAGRDRALLDAVPVARLIHTDMPRAAADERVGAVLDRLAAAGRAEAPVIGEDGRFLGLLRAQDARDREDAKAGALARRGAVVLAPDTSVWEAMAALDGFVGDAAPVVDHDGRLAGMVTEAAVIGAYLDTVHDLRREENAGA
ncbi:CBS domain-containing protein [Roseospira navarrensis]|uniref:CBS domain-containing protein n=2 Tax=Roseospira navarrensis TaxID=140058 RepID=A0A7X1ZCW3_9PROT|nr:chloride channel protein [Roseospira navarrensis]MQX35072.1 CBS domain-containing protein [Roseospira navarrensis]